MIKSKEEFARIWKKEARELSQLDYFIFLLINELDTRLNEEYFKNKLISSDYILDDRQVAELVVQLGDGLHFFYEQICFGKGCSLGCPNKLDLPFSKNEDPVRLVIIEQEFDGKAEACASREDCFKHDLMNYVVKDTLIDFYTYFMEMEIDEDNKDLYKIAAYLVNTIINFTVRHGSKLLNEPYKYSEFIIT